MQEQQRHDLAPSHGPAPAGEAGLEWALLGDILRRRAGLWAVLGPLLAAGLLLLLLWRVPPAFTSTASLSMQQESGGAGGGALAALSGLGGGGAKSYLGVIRSRRFAAAAAGQAGIQQIYGLSTADEATDLIQKSVTLEDRNDGLLYLGVTLPGPPRLSPNAAAREAQVRGATKQVTDAYIQSLSRYLKTSNSNRGASLLRQAGRQLDGARAAYNASVRRLTAMAAGEVSPGAAVVATGSAAGATVRQSLGDPPAAKTAAGTPDTSGSSLQQLYLSRGQLAAEIQAAEAERSGTSRLAAGQISALTALPAEDPLLAEARSQVRRAAAELQNLRIDLADDNPDVVAARERLKEAQARLRLQSRALQRGQTSEAVQLGALQAKYAAVTRQIGAAERDFKTGRRFGAEVEQQRNDMLLNLEVYKTAATQYAILSMQTVAGGSLMDVIDEGRVPASGKPGLGTLAAISIGVVLFALNLWLSFEYLVRVRQNSRRQLTTGREAQKLEAQKLEAQKLEAQKLEAQKLEAQKLEAQNGIVPR